MIKTTPKQIMFAMQHDAWAKITGVSTPGDYAWEIQEVVETLVKTVEFYNKRRIALLEQYGEKEEKSYTFPDEESEQEFQKQHQKILDFPVKLDVNKLDARHAEAAQLTVAEILAFRWLFNRSEVEMDDPFAGLD